MRTGVRLVAVSRVRSLARARARRHLPVSRTSAPTFGQCECVTICARPSPQTGPRRAGGRAELSSPAPRNGHQRNAKRAPSCAPRARPRACLRARRRKSNGMRRGGGSAPTKLDNWFAAQRLQADRGRNKVPQRVGGFALRRWRRRRRRRVARIRVKLSGFAVRRRRWKSDYLAKEATCGILMRLSARKQVRASERARVRSCVRAPARPARPLFAGGPRRRVGRRRRRRRAQRRLSTRRDDRGVSISGDRCRPTRAAPVAPLHLCRAPLSHSFSPLGAKCARRRRTLRQL